MPKAQSLYMIGDSPYPLSAVNIRMLPPLDLVGDHGYPPARTVAA